jgi:hypothetical protein
MQQARGWRLPPCLRAAPGAGSRGWLLPPGSCGLRFPSAAAIPLPPVPAQAAACAAAPPHPAIPKHVVRARHPSTPCCSLEELSLTGNPRLVVGPATAQQLAAAAPRLAHLRLSLHPRCGGDGGDGGAAAGPGAAAAEGREGVSEAERLGGLRMLAQLFGRRLVLEP